MLKRSENPGAPGKDEKGILLADVPTELKTPRLVLRAARAEFGAITYSAVRESLPELKRWMPWATDAHSIEDARVWFQKAEANFLLRKELHFPSSFTTTNISATADYSRSTGAFVSSKSAIGSGRHTSAMDT